MHRRSLRYSRVQILMKMLAVKEQEDNLIVCWINNNLRFLDHQQFFVRSLQLQKNFCVANTGRMLEHTEGLISTSQAKTIQNGTSRSDWNENFNPHFIS